MRVCWLIPRVYLRVQSCRGHWVPQSLVFLLHSFQNVYADVKVKVASSGGKEIVSANLTFLK